MQQNTKGHKTNRTKYTNTKYKRTKYKNYAILMEQNTNITK